MKAMILVFLCAFQTFLSAQTIWQPTNGPSGAWINDLLFTSEGIALAATSGGVFRSEDQGRSWRSADKGIGSLGVTVLAQAPDGDVFAGSRRGLYRSTDLGLSWQLTNFDRQRWVSTLGVADNNDIIVGSAGRGLFRSTDDGGSWIKGLTDFDTTSIAGPLEFESLSFSSTGDIFVTAHVDVSTMLIVSRDGGATWSALARNIGSGWLIDLAIDSDDTMYLGTAAGGLIRSEDYGLTWTRIDTNAAGAIGLAHPVEFGRNGVLFAHISAFRGKRGVYRSDNRGASWERLSDGWPNELGIGSLTTMPSNSLLAGSSDYGLWRFDGNSAAWAEANDGLHAPSVTVIGIDRRDRVYAGAENGDIFRSDDEGRSWSRLQAGLGFAGRVNDLAFTSDGSLFAGYRTGGVFRSSDDGGTWQQAFEGITSKRVLSLAVNDEDEIFAATFNSGVARSTDYGDSWQRLIDDNVSELTDILITQSGTIVIGSTRKGIYFSLDNGETWNRVFERNHSQRRYAFTQTASGILFAAVSDKNGLYRSSDDGQSWELVDGELSDFDVNDLTVNSANHLFAATSNNGVLRSTDLGVSWQPYGSGLTSGRIAALAMDRNNRLFAGTDHRPVFVTSNPTTAVEDTPTGSDAVIALRNVGPNPFSSTVRISFRLSKPSKLRMTVYNVHGRKVYQTKEQFLPAGDHWIEWDNSGGVAGCYLYRLDAGMAHASGLINCSR